MKKGIVFMAVGAMFFAITTSSCMKQNQHKDYNKNENGLYYRFHVQNEGAQPQIGDVLEVVLGCTVNDTTTIIPSMSNVMKFGKPLFKGDIFEGLAMMHKGDSASFIVDIDSTMRTFFGQPSLPAEFKSDDVMRFEVKLNDFYSESEYAKKMAEATRVEARQMIQKRMEDYPDETAAADKALQKFMKKNGVVAEPTETGLFYVMTTEGNGEKPVLGKKVKVHYTGRLLDGKVFDSSVERGEPFEFPLGMGMVIPGWDEGIQLMSKGEKGVLYIPCYLAYGERAMGDNIPAFSNLIFEVELVDFEGNE